MRQADRHLQFLYFGQTVFDFAGGWNFGLAPPWMPDHGRKPRTPHLRLTASLHLPACLPGLGTGTSSSLTSPSTACIWPIWPTVFGLLPQTDLKRRLDIPYNFFFRFIFLRALRCAFSLFHIVFCMTRAPRRRRAAKTAPLFQTTGWHWYSALRFFVDVRRRARLSPFSPG